MPEVTVNIYSRSYRLAVSTGEEALIQRCADHNASLLQDFFGKKRKHSSAGAGKAHSIIVILGAIHSKQLMLLRFVQHRANIFT